MKEGKNQVLEPGTGRPQVISSLISLLSPHAFLPTGYPLSCIPWQCSLLNLIHNLVNPGICLYHQNLLNSIL